MDHPWFKKRRYGLIPMPYTWHGWVMTAGFICVALYIGVNVDNRSHSVSDTLYGVAVPFLALIIAFVGITYLTRSKPEHAPRHHKK